MSEVQITVNIFKPRCLNPQLGTWTELAPIFRSTRQFHLPLKLVGDRSAVFYESRSAQHFWILCCFYLDTRALRWMEIAFCRGLWSSFLFHVGTKPQKFEILCKIKFWKNCSNIKQYQNIRDCKARKAHWDHLHYTHQRTSRFLHQAEALKLFHWVDPN